MTAEYYVVKERFLYVLRQERFRHLLESGHEHPHDTCAYAHTVEEMHSMVDVFGWDIDYPDENEGEYNDE